VSDQQTREHPEDKAAYAAIAALNVAAAYARHHGALAVEADIKSLIAHRHREMDWKRSLRASTTEATPCE
jgi:Skp family chaperone for outer membrane proteins